MSPVYVGCGCGGASCFMGAPWSAVCRLVPDCEALSVVSSHPVCNSDSNAVALLLLIGVATK